MNEKTAWRIYYFLNAAGIILGGLLSYLAGEIELGILFLVIATALYYYSLKYKYLPFWGNFVVSLLTAVTVMIVWLFELFFLKQSPPDFITIAPYFTFISQYIFGFAFLAFFVSFIREVAKDAQDKEGDQRHGCQTIPILLGEKKTKWLIMGLFLVTIILITLIQTYLYHHFRAMSLFLGLVTVLAIYALTRMAMTKTPANYRHISHISKTMLAIGLLSMIFLWFPN